MISVKSWCKSKNTRGKAEQPAPSCPDSELVDKSTILGFGVNKPFLWQRIHYACCSNRVHAVTQLDGIFGKYKPYVIRKC